MTRDEVIRLVKEAGLHVSQEDGVDEVLCCDGYHLQTEEVLKLVQLACASEREACAKRLDAVGCDHCAANIRARGNT